MTAFRSIEDRPARGGVAAGRAILRLVVGGRPEPEEARGAARVPAGAFVPVGSRQAAPCAGPIPRKHVLMLALALEVVVLGLCNADRYRPPGITVEQPARPGHAIA